MGSSGYIINTIARFACCSILLLVTLSSCQKYLDRKPSDSATVPSTLEDFQAVLDNQYVNESGPFFIELVTDNYYLTSATWSGQSADIRKNYTWDKDALVTVEVGSWTTPYQGIYHTNFILDGLKNIKYTPAEQTKYDNIKGSALFFRAMILHNLAQLYCKPYSPSAASDLGLIIKTTADAKEPIFRSTVQQTYDRIIADAKEALDLLPAISVNNMLPNKAAVYGLLSRVYLSMNDFSNAGVNANNALAMNNALLDYNKLVNAGASWFPNPLTNPEIMLISQHSPTMIAAGNTAIIDSVLYRSYDANDLRKTVFFTLSSNNPYWKGSYNGVITPYSIFDGITTDELYLTRAEVNARAGNISVAMEDLNKLLRNRYVTGTFTDLTASSSTDALNKILVERRKELVFRGLRWSDLRRFNLEGANITLRRIVNNTEYTLPPNDLRWVLLIPPVEINRSGIQQNPR